jgi:hypothetical protein
MWHETQGGDVAGWVAKPAPHGPPVTRELRSKDRGVLRQSPGIGPRRRQTTRSPIATGFQPRSTAIRPAIRPRMSIAAIRPLMSRILVLSSMTSSVREAACQATMSMTPRTPPCANETSGTTSQPPRVASHVAAASWSRAWPGSASGRARRPATARTRRNERRAPSRNVGCRRIARCRAGQLRSESRRCAGCRPRCSRPSDEGDGAAEGHEATSQLAGRPSTQSSEDRLFPSYPCRFGR